MPLTSEQVNEWVGKFLVATSGGGGATPATDWKTLQDLFSKRSSVCACTRPRPVVQAAFIAQTTLARPFGGPWGDHRIPGRAFACDRGSGLLLQTPQTLCEREG